MKNVGWLQKKMEVEEEKGEKPGKQRQQASSMRVRLEFTACPKGKPLIPRR